MADTLKPKALKPDGLASTDQSKKSNKKATPLSKSKASKRDSAIPKEIANRMARRIAITTGIPTFSGMSVFVISYLLVSRGIADIPPAITLLASASCFLMGLLGLSYGILSASWENSAGSLLGFENVRPNISKVREAVKALNQNKDLN